MTAPSKSSLAKLGLRAAGVAHDIAHPLSVALLAAQNIEGKGSVQLKASLRRMEKLLQSLRTELRDKPTKALGTSLDLTDLGKDIYAGLKLSDQKRVSFKLKGMVKTDAVALHRIMENLVLNALRHSDGDVEVTQTHKANQLTLLVNGGAKKRKPTKVPKGVIEKRLEGKKNKSSIKENRKKVKSFFGLHLCNAVARLIFNSPTIYFY